MNLFSKEFIPKPEDEEKMLTDLGNSDKTGVLC